jgi:hypothetical protein
MTPPATRHFATCATSRVLATSLFWLDDHEWWPYVPVFVATVASAERACSGCRVPSLSGHTS